MIKLFEYSNFKITLAAGETLLVKEFKDIVESDKSKDKEGAFKVFQYIWLSEDWSSPYADYSLDEKHIAAKSDCGLSDKELKSKPVEAARLKYREILDSNLLLHTIRTIKGSINRYLEYFNNVNFTEKVESGAKKGTMLYSVSEYLDAMKKSKDLMESIKTLEKAAIDEMKQSAINTRGDQDLGYEKY
jgi:hypothetical protein